MKKKIWTKDELLLAFNLYCKLPFNKIDSRNTAVIELSSIIDRTPSAVALKLVNFARFDPVLKDRNISGMIHGSKAEEEIWAEFHGDWDKSAYKSEKLLAEMKNESIEELAQMDLNSLPIEGREREAVVKTRVNQNFFRSVVLSSYGFKCCITGIQLPELLVASHIVPWSIDKKSRMDPANGVCLNLLHDKAFDRGLITITTEYKIRLSKLVVKSMEQKVQEKFFLPYEGVLIHMPHRFLPNRTYLKYHNEKIFRN
ncbi:MAG: HNH endonuclease [Candidatus Omnitrophica bacterium]|nr:HNH endonuclease [Candidatus Omnitrophota bacterium]